MAELDQKIEGILLQRLVAIIQVWCTDFDRNDDGDMRRDTVVPVRDGGKRRGVKGSKEEKVCFFFFTRMSRMTDVTSFSLACSLWRLIWL